MDGVGVESGISIAGNCHFSIGHIGLDTSNIDHERTWFIRCETLGKDTVYLVFERWCKATVAESPTIEVKSPISGEPKQVPVSQ